MATAKTGTQGASKGKKSAKSKASKSAKATLSVTKSDKTNNVTALSTNMAVSSSQRQQMIETAAYLIAEKRGFVGGDSNEDWLSAEKQIDTYLNSESGSSAVA